MARVVPDELVEPVCQVLLGAVDVDGGLNPEQRSVLLAIVTGYWGRPDLDLDQLQPLDPQQAAAAIVDPAHRRRTRELMVLLELCRHPFSPALVARVDEYATALGESGPGLEAARDLVRGGAALAAADYRRHVDELDGRLSEPSLRDAYPTDLAAPDPELAGRLRALHDLPEGTLGWEYVEFYRVHGFELPGDDVNMPAIFVEHDMCHVIGGYPPTGPGEIALGAMQLAVSDTDAHWLGFIGNLSVHEAAFTDAAKLEPKAATLSREGAPALMAEALRRGSECTGDFTTADHLARAAVPLEEVRKEFGVPPRDS